MFTQNFKFSTCFPHVHLCSFYMQNAYEFLNETFRSEKGEKKLFFCKLNIKDDNVSYTDIYIYIYMITIKIFTCWYMKKVLKNVYAFFIKFLATSKQLIRRNFIYCLKNQVIFHRASIEIGLTPPLPLFVFICSLRTPSLLHNKSRVSHRCWEHGVKLSMGGGAFQNLIEWA